MKISASIYSNKVKSAEELVKELDAVHVDFIHIDCNDDMSVFDDVRRIRAISQTPIDLHIISNQPEKFFNEIRATGVDLVTFQYENLTSQLLIPADIKASIGLAIVSDTSLAVVKEYENVFDFILFMTTTPGRSGGVFNKENFRRIREFKKQYPGKQIHVDGGVTSEVAFVLRNMGVYAVVSGSYLVNADDAIGRALHRLRSNDIVSHTAIGDFMLSIDETPVVARDASFMDVLEQIEQFNLGFTAVIDNENKLDGIISNADVRRGLIRNNHRLEQITVKELINPTPFKINASANVSEMLTFIKSIKATILFLPVVDDHNRLQGVVTFNNLIKGE